MNWLHIMILMICIKFKIRENIFIDPINEALMDSKSTELQIYSKCHIQFILITNYFSRFCLIKQFTHQVIPTFPQA